MIVFQNQNYRLEFEEPSRTLCFRWEDGHRTMTYAQFQEACSNFLGYGFEYQAQNILIDVRNFELTLPPEFPEWQRTEHYPRYYKLGIDKVTYVMPEAALAHAEEPEKEPGKFEQRHFATLEEAYSWLAA